MAGKVLLVNHSTAFFMDALVAGLEKVGIETAQVDPEIVQIEREQKDTDVFLLFAGFYMYDPTKLLSYLRDLCADGKKHLCLFGYSKEIAKIEEVIPKSMIAHEFIRPIDVKTLTEKLRSIVTVEKERQRKKHILLVDDDVAFLRMMQGWLSEKYQVTSVKSGMQAFTYLATHVPDLILLDYDMPIAAGPQVLELIRSEPASARIPVIFLTGKDDRQSVMTAMSRKPDGYLLKSMTKEDILAATDRLLEAKALEKGGEAAKPPQP